MAQVVFRRGTKQELKSMPIVDGQLIYDTETGEEWIDVGGKRLPIKTAGGGSDGGYYTPEVRNGVLSWTASKPGMPDVGSASVKGQDGKTPIKGVDYWTAQDKQGIVNDVLKALPTWKGESY